ncbi:MAG: helix-turn-helix domain-containing protein [Sphingobacteriales bacterium JAD_PAG50586_3]|nr:MAG: helix-turn-helix domain-containing protein [Sphingobacteriales bacterium JAD_PAG50586_3]
MSGADMRMRYGSGEVSENLFYANLNADAFATGRATLGERLVTLLDDMVKETGAEVVIIDQPDRMHLQPAMWNYFMLKLNALKVQQGVSILITLNNKPRNLSKAPTISSLYKSNLLAPHADSIVCIANHCRQEGKRYIKLLKNTALPLGENALVEVLEIGLQNNEILLQPPTILSVQVCGTEQEEKVLQPTATERRNARMILAEEMRCQGMSFRDIAIAMELPERTVRSWVSFIGERAVRSEEREVASVEGGGVSDKHEQAYHLVSGERGGGFGLVQTEHAATPPSRRRREYSPL